MALKAYLYDVKRYYTGEEYPSEDEFIVACDDEAKRDKEASRVYEWYVENAKENLTNSALGKPQLVEGKFFLEDTKELINWRDLQERQMAQHKTRPRGIGCVFRGGAPEPYEDFTKEEMSDLRESIEHFMDEHRAGDNSYLFIGSRWRLEDRLRYGKIAVFEACGIELASDIAQLEFLSQTSETVFINWCCTIYVV
ncbi:MAG: hypothetical protein ABFS45_26235 [Pseudomonadota bacterium]